MPSFYGPRTGRELEVNLQGLGKKKKKFEDEEDQRRIIID